jgi:argininosuccinate synthase
MIENRLVGIKSREVYEAPAAVVLHAAHRELEGIVIPRDLRRLKSELATKYADMVYNGLWFSPAREAIDALVAKVQEKVTGTVRIRLFKGNHRIVGRQSPYALYDHGLATYDEGDRFDHSAAVGFIKIWGLPIETSARLEQRRARGGRRESRERQVASAGSFQSVPGFRDLASDGS